MSYVIQNQYSNLPAEMRNQCQTFVLWRNVKGNKVPIDWLGGKRGNNSQELHMTFEVAEQTLLKHENSQLGLYLPHGGLRITVNGQTGWLHVIDLDGFLCNGQWGDESETIWEILGQTYCEISPSRTGMKIFVVSDAPPRRKIKYPFSPSEFYSSNPTIKKYGDSHGVEWFTESFYVALTGINSCGTLKFVSTTELEKLHNFLLSKSIKTAAENKKTLDIRINDAGRYSKLVRDSLILVLSRIDHHDEENWSQVSNSLARAYGEEGRKYFHKWSQDGYGQNLYPRYSENECNSRFERSLRETANKVGFGCKHLCEMANIAPFILGYESARTSQDLNELCGQSLVKEINHISEHKDDEWPTPKLIEAAIPKAQPFDFDLLPNAIRPFVEDQSDLMQAPPDYLAAGLMVAMAAAVGTKIAIAPKAKDTSWLVPLVLWGGAVGRPGTMKSPAISKAFRPLSILETEMAKDFDKKLALHELELMKYEVARKTAQASITKGQKATLPIKPEAPQPERLLVNDSTTQKLAEILQHSPLGILTLRDEVTGLLESLSAEGQEAARGFLLEAWNGQSSYRVDRIGRGSFVIPRLAVWLFGGIQPGKLQPYVKQATKGGNGDDGLLQRFQIVVWPEPLGKWKNVDRHPDLNASQTVDNVFRQLRSIDPVNIGAVIDPLGDRLAYLHFDDGAQEVFDVFREKLESQLRKETLHPALESHLAKYRSLVPALALLIHLIDQGQGSVSKGALLKAIKWATYLRSHAKKIYASATNPPAFSASTLANRLQAKKLNDGFTSREVMRHGWQYLSSTEDVREAIDWLIECNWLKLQEKVPSNGGRPTATYLINPKIYSL